VEDVPGPSRPATPPSAKPSAGKSALDWDDLLRRAGKAIRFLRDNGYLRVKDQDPPGDPEPPISDGSARAIELFDRL